MTPRTGRPYVSHVKLYENAHSAMLSSIELYNKPRIPYRNEIVVILAVNAWELAIKARLRQEKLNIHKTKQRDKPYETKTLDQCLNLMRNNKLWPSSVDGVATQVNIEALSEFRNRAIHLYNEPALGPLLYRYLQQTVVNFRDFLVAVRGLDLAKSITWDLLPIAATTPHEAVQYLRADAKRSASQEVVEFIQTLEEKTAEVEKAHGDLSRVYTYYDVSMHNKKNAASADLHVAVDPNSSSNVIKHIADPEETWPYSRSTLLEKVNRKRKGRTLTNRDFDAVMWRDRLREEKRFSSRQGRSKSVSYAWSDQAYEYLRAKNDDYFDQAKQQFNDDLKKRKALQEKSE